MKAQALSKSLASLLPNVVKYKLVNFYGTVAGIFLAILANIISEIHIDFKSSIDIYLLIKFIICLSQTIVLQYLYLNISSIKEVADREYGSYLEDCKNNQKRPNKDKKVEYFNNITKLHPTILLSPYAAIILLIVYMFIN